MRIWILTQLGRTLARSTLNPDTDGWRIVHYLDKVHQSTPEGINEGLGMDLGMVDHKLRELKRKTVVQEVGSGQTAVDTNYEQAKKW